MNLVKKKEENTNLPIINLFSIIQLIKGKRKKNINLIKNEEFIAHFNQKGSIERGNYLKIIRKWGKYFPSNQIFIGDYNQLKNSPQKLLNEVFNFLEVKQVSDWKGYPIKKEINKTINKNKNIPDQLHEYLLNLYSNDLKTLKTKIPNIKW
jgi:hypothetical protein